MALFGNSKKMDAIIEEGHGHMIGLQRARDRALALASRSEAQNRELGRRLAAASRALERERTARRRLEANHETELEELRGELEEARAEGSLLRAEAARVERERAVLERAEERAVARIERLEEQQRATNDEMEELNEELSDTMESTRELRRRNAKLEGLITGWAPLVLGDTSVTRPQSEKKADRKQVLRGQAALARARKTDVSPQARLRMLEQAERLVDLPEDLQADLRALRQSLGEND